MGLLNVLNSVAIFHSNHSHLLIYFTVEKKQFKELILVCCSFNVPHFQCSFIQNMWLSFSIIRLSLRIILLVNKELRQIQYVQERIEKVRKPNLEKGRNQGGFAYVQEGVSEDSVLTNLGFWMSVFMLTMTEIYGGENLFDLVWIVCSHL